MCVYITWGAFKNADSDLVGLRGSLGFCISDELCCDADVSGLQISLRREMIVVLFFKLSSLCELVSLGACLGTV